MFSLITLSTGTTINIPIFDPQQDKFTPIARTNCVLRVEDMSGSIIFSKITDSELLELANYLLNGSYTQIGFKRNNYESPRTGKWAMFMYWYYDPNSNAYRLCHPFRTDTSGVPYRIDCHLCSFANNTDFMRFYNNETPNPDGNRPVGYNIPVEDTRNYIKWIAWCKTNDYSCPPNGPMFNLHSGGFYTLSIFARLGTGSATNRAIPSHGYTLESAIYNNIELYVESHPNTEIDITDSNGYYPDPYGNIISVPGGNDGDPFVDPENIEKGTIPALPSLSAVDAGMITMYYCTNAQLQALANYLWTNIYDLETNFVKLFANPMDCIIGLGIVPVMPALGSAAAVHFGNISTSVYMTKLSSQFVEYDMGSVAIPKWLGCFMDYAPYVKISIYLPYIGYRDLSADDVVGDTIHVVYHIDCLTGGCCAFVETGKKGLLYTFNGSCIANVPLTATNYSTAIQNAVSAVGAGLTTVAGIATGAAPIAAAGVAAGLSNAANTAINSKPQIQRSGAMGGAAGLMSYQRPQLIIERPRMCVPARLNHFKGNTLYITKKLNACSGFTQIDMINLDNIPCTAEERSELERILHEGVYF